MHCQWGSLLVARPVEILSYEARFWIHGPCFQSYLAGTSILSPWVHPCLRCTDPMTHIPPSVASNATNKQDSSSIRGSGQKGSPAVPGLPPCRFHPSGLPHRTPNHPKRVRVLLVAARADSCLNLAMTITWATWLKPTLKDF